MESYTEREVVEIIKAYTEVLEAKTYFYHRTSSDDFIENLNGIEKLEGALIVLKRLTSIELREMLPNINIKSLEELCKKARGID